MKSFCWFLVLTLFACYRKPRTVLVDEIPDLPCDTVQVVRVLDRCNYQYLSADPRKARHQLDRVIQELDHLIIEYDTIIQQRRAELRKQSALIKQLSK